MPFYAEFSEASAAAARPANTLKLALAPKPQLPRPVQEQGKPILLSDISPR